MERENSLIKVNSNLITKINKNFDLVDKIINTVDLQNWWHHLDEEWKKNFRKIIAVDTEPSLNDLQNLMSTNEIYCVYTKINTLEPLRVFNNLKKVNLMMCEDIQNLEPLINNKKITNLELVSTKVTNIEVLKHFTFLEELLLSDYVIDLNPLSNLINLKKLFFRHCLTIQSLEPLVMLENLEELVVSDTITNLMPIDNFKKIKRLVCYGVEENEAKRYKQNHPTTEIIFGENEKKKNAAMVASILKLIIK